MTNTNLLDLNHDVWNIIGGYVKDDNLERMKKFKQDILEYVDIKMKIKRKEAREQKYYISRRNTRIQIWRSIDEFCRNQFGNL